MYIKNRLIAIVFRTIGIAFCILGIISVTFITGSFSGSVFLYYTVMSNIAVMLFLIVALGNTIHDLVKHGIHGETSRFPLLSFIVTVDITLTMMVYWCILAPTSFSMGGTSFLLSYQNIVVHTVVPIFMILEFLLFTKRRALKKREAPLVLIFPYAYLIMAIILGVTGEFFVSVTGVAERFPYDFLDVYVHGWLVLVYVAGISFGMMAFAFGYYLIDRFASRKEVSIYCVSKKGTNLERSGFYIKKDLPVT